MAGAADPMMSFPAGTTFTPYSVLRNVSDQPIQVSPTLWWMAAAAPRSAQLPSFTVPPGQTQSLNMPALLASASLNNFNGSMNLILDVQGPARGLLLTSGSVDQKNTYVFEVRPVGVGESNAKSLGYWSIGNGDDTMVTLWNAADEAQDLVFTLFFTGGHYNFPIHLGPRATNTFNISEIVHSQIPDAEGNVVPASAHEGSARISGTRSSIEHILVGMAAGTYNVAKATCAVICYNCNGTVAFDTIDPNPLAVGVGVTASATFAVGFTDGDGYDYTTLSTWTTNSTSIAAVQSAGVIKGMAAGSFTTSTVGPKETLNVVCCSDAGSCSCPQIPTTGTGSGTAGDNTPILTGIDPSDWPSGVTTSGVTFSGQYFGTNPPTLTFSPSSGISYGLVSYNDTQIVANIAVASGTPTEQVQVSVTNNGYGGSGFVGVPGSSASSAPIYATVRAPLNTAEITIIAWVNGNAPDLNPLPTGENSTLQGNLQNGTFSQQVVCALQVSKWIAGAATNITTSADQAYANAWLVKNSANTAPPSTITPSVELAGGNYRLFNDFGGSGLPLGPQVGSTPDPCKTGFLDWAGAGQPSQYEGYSSTSPAGQVYQINEGRIGTAGQAGSMTINGGRTVPWIWSVIEFNSANGTPNLSPPHAMFPTYSLYVNGTLTYTFAQSTVAAFTAQDQTYQLTPSQIP
jgi:hypothetical protein